MLLLLLAIWLLIQLNPVQNWLVKKAAGRLSKELNTEVTVKHVDFSLFNKMHIEGVMLKDRNKDTLIYAGRASVNITDWFFLKDKAELSYISLEDATVYLHRKDSIWNYRFLTDYFSSPSTGSKKKGIEFNLKKIELKNIHLLQKDEWAGQDMEGKLGYLSLQANDLNIASKKIDISNLTVLKPVFSITNYQGKRPKKKTALTDEEFHQNDTILLWNKAGWQITAANVKVENGEFRNEKITERKPYEHFDGLHIRFYEINGTFTNAELHGDTLKTHASLSAKERSGFAIKKMDAAMLWHTTGMEFTNLDVSTDKSHLSNAFAMKYSNFNHDMSDFITHVRMQGSFTNSELHSDDIAFFAPELKSWNRKIFLSGKVRGTVDHLKGDGMIVKTGKETLLEGNFTIDGLPDIDNTFLDVKANKLNTSYADVAAIYPGIKKITKPNIAKLQRLNFNGSFTGYLKDFVAYGTAQTNLGTAVTDVNFKFPNGADPIYSGRIKTNGFELGTFINEPLLGRIVMDGTLKGRGFTPSSLFAEVDGRVQEITVNKYRYTNITAKGILERRKFDGAFTIKDPNLAMNLTGLVDFSRDTPVYKVNGSIYKSNFKTLNLGNQDLAFSGDIDFNFKLKKIEDFTGTAVVKNAQLMNNGTPLSFDSLFVSNTFTDKKNKLLVVKSNEIDATFNGNFDIVNLPDAALIFLHKYLPAYIPAPRGKAANQDFTFNIETKNIGPFIGLFDKNIRGFENSTINGQISSNQNIFELNSRVPSFEYGKIYFKNINVEGKGDLTNLVLKGDIEEIKLTDSLQLPYTSFTATAANDTGSFSIKTSATQTVKDADLKAKFFTSREGFSITFLPSTVVLNDKTWTIENESNLFVGRKQILSDGMKVTSGKEEIFLSTQPSETGTREDLVVELRKVQAGDIMPYLLPDPRLEGSVSGRIDVLDPFGKMRVETDLVAEKFTFNDSIIGTVKLKGNYNPETGDINTELQSENTFNEFFSTGKINIKDPKNPTIDQEFDVKNFKIGILEKYLSVIMKDMKGLGNGRIRVKGNANRPELIGNVKLNDASFLLDYTKCRYIIEDESEITFREGELDFGKIQLKDTSGRQAFFSGKLYHTFFRKMSFDMNFETKDKRKGLLVLNTTKKDNSLFYGKVIASAGGRIQGPSYDMKLTLQGAPTDSSSVFIPTSDSKVTGTSDFIVFRKYGREMKGESEVKESSNLTVDIDIAANPLVKINLILDEITGDIIEGQGRGNLNIRVATNEKTTMSGNIEITRGKYTYDWQSIIKKPFTINKGTIDWGVNGDPYNAKIDIDVNYIVNTSLPQNIATSCGNARSDILVVGNLSNTLREPKIEFSLELPPGHPCRNDPLTDKALRQLYSNTDELNKQVTSLLFTGYFITQDQGVNTNTITGAAGTVTQFLSQQISSQLRNVLRKVTWLKGFDIDVLVNPEILGTNAQTAQAREGGSAVLTQVLMSGRLVIKAGGKLLLSGIQTGGVSQQSRQLVPDVSVQFLITPNGTVRLIGFYRNIFDNLGALNNRSGISLTFLRERNNFWDLFKTDKRLQAETLPSQFKLFP
jgi:hypothetical protein